MNVTGASTKEQQLDELITLAQDAETAYARSRAPDGGGYARPTYAQFVRIIVAIRDRHEQMVLGDKALVEKKDLAAVLDFVVGRGPIIVVESDELDRLFAALKEAIARGES